MLWTSPGLNTWSQSAIGIALAYYCRLAFYLAGPCSSTGVSYTHKDHHPHPAAKSATDDIFHTSHSVPTGYFTVIILY
ncbi:hypothetical protein GQ600_10590 [Phytophthora cactorum]|nr:hypothetical protein GQ600_10590 [Phytophthora cactorum]